MYSPVRQSDLEPGTVTTTDDCHEQQQQQQQLQLPQQTRTRRFLDSPVLYWVTATLLLGVLVAVTTGVIRYALRDHLDAFDVRFPSHGKVVSLAVGQGFHLLPDDQKLYLYYASRATWFSSLITATQSSTEAPLIMALFLRLLHHGNNLNEVREFLQKEVSFSSYEVDQLFLYMATFFDLQGNYREQKFIPNVAMERMEDLVHTMVHRISDQDYLTERAVIPMFVYDERVLRNGEMPPRGVSSYYSTNFNQTDLSLVSDYLKYKNVEPWNQRAVKIVDGNTTLYELRLASVSDDMSVVDDITMRQTETYRSSSYRFVGLDYAGLLKKVISFLETAKQYASDSQSETLNLYIEHLTTGSIVAHKRASAKWIAQNEPVDFHMGFLETYRDPAGERGEFQAFVAVRAPLATKRFESFVNHLATILPLLPWPAAYGNGDVLSDGSSLIAVDMTAMSSIVPLAVSLPNYNDVKASAGSKNVVVMNRVDAQISVNPPRFFSPEDIALMERYAKPIYILHTATHELLGHGSGRLFLEDDNATVNFSLEHMLNPITGKLVNQWYKRGESFQSVFGAFSNVFEECRAEAVYLALSLEPEVLARLGYAGEEADDVAYGSWLNLVMKAVDGFVQHQDGEWRGEYAHARYVLLSYLRRKAKGLVRISARSGNVLITVNRSRIYTTGREVIRAFLVKLQVYKSTADFTGAMELFDGLSQVGQLDGGASFAEIRQLVKSAGKREFLAVQPNVILTDGNVTTLREYPSSIEGLLDSWRDRFTRDETEELLRLVLEQHRRDVEHFF